MKRWHALEVIRGGAVACARERIVAAVPRQDVTEQVELAPNATVMHAVGRVVTLGLVEGWDG